MTTYDDYFRWLMVREGVISDRAPEADPGGLTKYGITRPFWDHYVKGNPTTARFPDDLTLALAKQVYHYNTWAPVGHMVEWSNPITVAVTDFVIHSGQRRAISTLQLVVGAREDGVMGPRTKEALKKFLNRNNIGLFIEHYLAERQLFLIHLPNWRYNSRGWTRRLFGLSDLITTGRVWEAMEG